MVASEVVGLWCRREVFGVWGVLRGGCEFFDGELCVLFALDCFAWML